MACRYFANETGTTELDSICDTDNKWVFSPALETNNDDDTKNFTIGAGAKNLGGLNYPFCPFSSLIVAILDPVGSITVWSQSPYLQW